MRSCIASGGFALLMVMTVAFLGGCAVTPLFMPVPSSGRPADQGVRASGPPKVYRSSQVGAMKRQDPSAPTIPSVVRPPASDAGEPAHAGSRQAPPAPTLAALRAGLQAPDDTRLQRLREEAEAAYQGRQTPAAIEAFTMLVELDPQDARAWLRLGNLYQRKLDIAAAARAYRRAADLRADGREEREIRQKALLNLTLLGIERARQALAELDREAIEPALADARSDVRRQLDELVRGIDAGPARQPVAVTPGSPPTLDAAVSGSIDQAAPTSRTGPRAMPRGVSRRADAAAHRLIGEGDAAHDAADDAARGEGPVRIDYLQGRPAR